MNSIQTNGTDRLLALFHDLAEAGLAGNSQRVELLALTAVRAMKGENPHFSEQLGALLAQCSTNHAAMRSQGVPPSPVDPDEGLSLLRMVPTQDAVAPVLNAGLFAVVTRFLNERSQSALLLREGLLPPRTLLVKGPPGTGKTMLSRWLARQLGLPLMALDLASSISSYLGKTGSNLRRSLDYARATPCLLLLDEFDAIAKRRDDTTEVGELKRIVNVLLKELEDWPLHSVLVAATNHPELLDPAIHRRFDVVIEIPLPDQSEREAILLRGVGHFSASLSPAFVSSLATVLDGSSGSDLDTAANGAVRRHVVEGLSLPQALVEAALKGGRAPTNAHLGILVRGLRDHSGLSVRDIAVLLGKGASTIQYHLTAGASKPRSRRNA